MSNRSPGPLKLPAEFAEALAKVRHLRERESEIGDLDSPGPLERTPRLRLETVTYVEEKLGVTLPSEVIGWYAAGLTGEGKWGNGDFVDIDHIATLTEKFREELEDLGEPAFDPEEYIAFDFDSGDYLLVKTDQKSPLERISVAEAGALEDEPFTVSLISEMEQWMTTTYEELQDEWPEDEPAPHDADVDPFEVVLYTEPADDADDAEEGGQQVNHPKFGSGRIIRRMSGDRDKYLVEFDEVGRKKMLGEFLEWD